MEASKVTLSNFKLTNKQKRKLQETKIVEFVQSKPYGTALAADDLGQLLGTSAMTARKVVKSLLDRGRLSREKVGQRYTYTVNSPVKVVKPAETVEQATPSEVTNDDALWQTVKLLRHSGLQFSITIGSEPATKNLVKSVDE